MNQQRVAARSHHDAARIETKRLAKKSRPDEGGFF
jgi:hypothetical protein